jgi:hypothetical protein
VPTGLVLVILALLYRGILRDLAIQWWDDPNYSHGFLVLLVQRVPPWQQRHELRAIAPRGRCSMVVLIAGILSCCLAISGPRTS